MGGVYGSKVSKLERFLISRNLLASWLSHSTVALPRAFLDHGPIILNDEGLDFGRIPFKVFNSWLKHPSLSEVVSKAWPIMTPGTLLGPLFISYV